MRFKNCFVAIFTASTWIGYADGQSIEASVLKCELSNARSSSQLPASIEIFVDVLGEADTRRSSVVISGDKGESNMRFLVRGEFKMEGQDDGQVIHINYSVPNLLSPNDAENYSLLVFVPEIPGDRVTGQLIHEGRPPVPYLCQDGLQTAP